MFDYLRRRKLRAVASQIGLPASIDINDLAAEFASANGISFCPWKEDHVRTMRRAVTMWKLKYIERLQMTGARR